MNVVGGGGFGTLTQAFGTVISRLVPPRSGAFTRITKVVYTAAGTAHTITVMRHIGTRVKLTSAASINQAVINLSADPGNTGNAIAANDWIALRHDDGITRLHRVSSVSTLAITLTANLTVAASANQPVWFFGAVGDTDPKIGEAHNALAGIASATTTYEDAPDGAGLFSSHASFEPILVQSNNATAAGTLQQLTYKHTT
jgi:hypothetical protein